MIGRATLYTVGEFSNRLSKSLAVLLIAYVVTKEQYGVYNYLLAASAIVSAMLDAGLNTLIILRGSVHRFTRLFRLFLLAKLAVVAAVIAALLLAYGLTPLLDNVAAKALPPFVAISLAVDLQAFVSNSLRARLDYAGDALVKLIGSLGFMLLLGAWYLARWPLDAAGALWVQSAALAAAVCIGAWRLHGAARWAGGHGHFRRGMLALLAISLPFAASSFSGSFFNTIDTLVLGALSAFDANATFGLMHRIGLLTHLPIGIFVGFILPQLTAQFGRPGAARAGQELTDWLVRICLCGAVVMSQLYLLFVAWVIVPALGGAWDGAVHTAATLSLYVVPIYCYSVLNTVLIAKRCIVSPSMVFAAATGLSAGLDYLLVRSGSPLQVAWVCSGMNWALLVAFALLYRSKLGAWPMRPATALMVAAAGGLVLLLALLPSGEAVALARVVGVVAAVAVGLQVFRKGRHVARQLTLRTGA